LSKTLRNFNKSVIEELQGIFRFGCPLGISNKVLTFSLLKTKYLFYGIFNKRYVIVIAILLWQTVQTIVQ
jgi:hypothetical protein